ncbi:MAG: mechanosensitive ion channel family protein [Christensenellales bacterium]
MDWAGIWNSIKTFFTNNFWGVVKFFAILIIGIIVVKVVLNITRRVMNKTKMEKVTQGFLYAILKFALYLLLLLLLLSAIGVSMSGVLTAISAMLLAVGMALQGNISNVANGIVIVSSHMFKKGDYVSVSGVEGSIYDINFLFTTIMTTDNKKVTIPNSSFVNNAVTNFGANPTRRISFSFSVAYESDVEQVRNIILAVMNSNGKVRQEKPPFCRLNKLNDNSIDFNANCWVDSEDYWDVYYYVVENVFNEFKRNNISIPYGQIEVRERKDNVVMPFNAEPLPERVEKERKQTKHFDLENDDLMSIFKHKKESSKKQSKKEEKKAS